jgi:hypothetical protein
LGGTAEGVPGIRRLSSHWTRAAILFDRGHKELLIAERALSLALLALIAGSLAYGVSRARRGLPMPPIRRIEALEALGESIGRATEMGRPVHFTAGTGRLTDQTAPVMLAALDVLGKTTELSADYGARLLVTTSDPVYHAMACDAVKSGYSAAGHAGDFREETVRFLSDTQFAYAAGTIGQIEREKVAANIIVGSFAAEGLLLAEAGANAGAVQIGGTTNMNILPFFVVACDYTLLGEEIYAAGAYLSKDLFRTSILLAQDYAKVASMVAIALGIVSLTLGSRAIVSFMDMYGK